MRLIVGLGNFGDKYEKTRHNVGFLVLDKIQATRYNDQNIMPFRLENQFKAEITQTGGIGENRVIFAKPNTYMNNSGEAVSKLMNYYKIGTDDILVISDDVDLEIGDIRVRLEGSSGGHKGLESIIQQIGDNRFVRIRVGIGSNREKGIRAEDYVLQNFSADENKIIKHAIDKTEGIVLNWIENNQIKEETITIQAF